MKDNFITEFEEWIAVMDKNLKEKEDAFLRGYITALKAVVDYLKIHNRS